MFFGNRCVGCGECVKVCPHGAIILQNGIVRITDACRACGTCVDACAAAARELAGRWLTAQEVMDEIERDRLFWEEAGGGVTFSGGEPLFQPQFLETLLDACRERKIHTAVETSGYASKRLLSRLAPKVDLFLVDLKLMDPAKHRIKTGRGNELILSNIRMLADAGRNLIIRYPVIPGINAEEENVRQMLQFLEETGLRRVDLLPFNPAGAEKYERLRLIPSEFECEGGVPMRPVERIASRFREHGFDVRIGG
jgi:pyruvate formate lyase activating enzyme